jgi:UDP-glucose:tetrahydrobiopterin glucosyltransferase
MRIALLAPLVARIAPPYLGGAEALLHDLAEGLARRGHTVTLYAADGSAVAGVRRISLGIDADALSAARVDLAPLAAAETQRDEAPDPIFFTQAHHFLRIAFHITHRADDYDLVHGHAYDWPAFAFGALLPLPVLHTLHLSNVSRSIEAALAAVMADDAGNTRLAAVSRACAATYPPQVRIDTVIYNGLDLAAIPFGPQPATPPYILFAGRVSPEKGIEDALAIARQAGRRLVVAGGIYDPAYFTRRVQPMLAEMEAAGLLEHVGLVPRERLWELMAGAAAVLCPIHWDEPFGLVACEAQAAGAPVVGYARGALPEIVADGETGWLVPEGDIAGAAEAVARVGVLSRAACRARVAERFSLKTMLDAYERVYGEMVSSSGITSD